MILTPGSDTSMLSQAAAEAADADEAFCVDLEGYEGPLHLLLDLARRHKIDLTSLSMLQLADQYLNWIHEARDRRMDIAADYLLMAAWLAFLKSKLLLPSQREDNEEDDPDALAGRLAFRLRRLEAMRQAVIDLYEGHLEGRDVFARGDPQFARVIRKPLWKANLHDILRAFGDINTRKVKQKAHVVARQPVIPLEAARQSLAKLAPALTDWAPISGMHVADAGLKEAPRSSELASFFSAALELTRNRVVDIRQDRLFAEVFVRASRPGQAPEAAP